MTATVPQLTSNNASEENEFREEKDDEKGNWDIVCVGNGGFGKWIVFSRGSER